MPYAHRMGNAASILGLLLGLVLMAVGFLILYFIVKAAVKSGTLEALDDPRATLAVHRITNQLAGNDVPAPQQSAPQMPQQPQYQQQQPGAYQQQGPPPR